MDGKRREIYWSLFYKVDTVKWEKKRRNLVLNDSTVTRQPKNHPDKSKILYIFKQSFK